MGRVEVEKQLQVFDALTVLEKSEDGTAAECKLVRLLMSDVGGQRRVRAVPKRLFQKVAADGVGWPCCIYGIPSYADIPSPGCGLNGSGEVRLIPDVRTLRRLPWCPEHAVALASAHTVPGTPFEYCPREALARLSRELYRQHGLIMHAAFETEFILFSSIEPKLVPVDAAPYSSAIGVALQADLITRIVDAIEQLGIPVEQIHSEAAEGQFEVSVRHAVALDAADRILLVREAIFEVAARHGLRCTFLPKVFESGIGTGAHVHASIWRLRGDTAAGGGGRELPPPEVLADVSLWENVVPASGRPGDNEGMSEEGRWFLAGVLQHLPAILALSCPLPNSYARLKPDHWAGAYQCWGHENREAGLRAVSPSVARGATNTGAAPPQVVTNFEMKCSDAAGQPHLVLGALIVAGMDGLQRKLPLPPPVEENPSEVAEARGIKQLPASLDNAVAAFEDDPVLQGAFGAALSRAIIAVRKADIAHYKSIDFEAAVRALIHKY